MRSLSHCRAWRRSPRWPRPPWALQVLGGIEFTWEHELHLVPYGHPRRLSRPTSKRGSPFWTAAPRTAATRTPVANRTNGAPLRFDAWIDARGANGSSKRKPQSSAETWQREWQYLLRRRCGWPGLVKAHQQRAPQRAINTPEPSGHEG